MKNLFITRNSKDWWKLGVEFQRYNGNPSVRDPMGLCNGFTVVASIGVLNFAYRRMLATDKIKESSK